MAHESIEELIDAAIEAARNAQGSIQTVGRPLFAEDDRKLARLHRCEALLREARQALKEDAPGPTGPIDLGS